MEQTANRRLVDALLASHHPPGVDRSTLLASVLERERPGGAGRSIPDLLT